MMPLTMATPGQELTLIDLNGGRGIRSKLYSMGLVPGVKSNSPYIISLLRHSLLSGGQDCL